MPIDCICFIMQVISGGNFDVDASITSPRNKTVYHVTRKPAALFKWNADDTGVYRFCFSNQFSAITHKIVSFDFRIIDDSTSDIKPPENAAISYVRAFIMSYAALNLQFQFEF